MARTDRPDPDDERAVDFVVGEPDAGADEDLPQPDGTRARARRVRVELGLGALALLVVVLVVRAESQPDTAPQAATSSSSTATTSTPPAPNDSVVIGPAPTPAPATPTHITPHPAFPVRVPQRHGTVPAACPGLRCSTSAALPAPVTDAVEAAFPESTVQRIETVRLRGRHRVLWYREVDVRVGTELLTVRVQAPAKGDRTGSGQRNVDGQRTSFVATSLGPWHVDVAVVDLLGGQAQKGPLVTLAHDPRLVAT